MTITTRFFSRLCALLLFLCVSHAACATCIPINTAPYVITQSGSYCIAADLAGYINIYANHVDLDFQGHTLTGSVGYYGVPGPLSTDFTVHNGTIITSGGGALFGLSIGGNYRNQPVTNINVDHMSVSSARNVGIAVVALDAKITNNTVSNIRNTSVYGFAAGIDLESIDIASSDVLSLPLQGSKAGSRAVIQNNVVTNVMSQTPDGNYVPGIPQAVGIRVDSFADISISGNTITNASVFASIPNGIAAGIYVDATKGFCGHVDCVSPQLGGLIVQNNTVSANPLVLGRFAHNAVGIRIDHGPDHALVTGSTISYMDTGISINNVWPGTPPVLLLDNVFSNVTTTTIGGITLPQ